MTNDKPGNSSDIKNIIRRAWIEVGIFSVIINVLLLIPSIYMIQVYDRVLPSASITTLIYLSLIALAGLAFLAILEIVRSIYCQKVALSVDQKLAESAFLASLHSAKASSGEIQPLRDLASVRNFIASKSLANILDLPFTPFFAIILFLIHPILCVVTLGGAAVIILLVIANQYAARSTAMQAYESMNSAVLLSQNFARNSETVRSMGMTGHVINNWGKRFAHASVAQDRAASINAIFAGSSRTLRMALQLAILGTGAILVMEGEITAGMIFASSIISGRTLQPIDQMVAGWRQIFETRKAWARLSAAISQMDAVKSKRVVLPTPTGHISVKDAVWAAQQGSENIVVLKRVSFEIRAGETVAIIGPSGAGKSTLAKLLAGVIMPTSGVVALDGADYKTWDTQQLGMSLGYLAQEVQLLPGSISQNIARFDEYATDQEVTDAAMRAEAHNLITRQKDGYQTVISESGSSLSGGTRQRIGLARAFFGNPKILVLDEPNSNLDAEGESALETAILQAKEAGTTVILVTHRPSIALKCDKTLLLNDGAIEAYGPTQDVFRHIASKNNDAKSSKAYGKSKALPGERLSLVSEKAE